MPDREFSYYPKTVLALGNGFSPSDLAYPKFRAVTFETVFPDHGAAVHTELSVYLVRNSEHLQKSLKIDASIDASYLAFDGGGDFTYQTDHLNVQNSVTLVISAETDFGRIQAVNIQPTTQAASLIADGDMEKFERLYGSEIVVFERRGASVHAIVSISDVSDNTKQSIDVSMEASGGWGPLSASASTSVKKELQEASKDGRVSIQVVSTGGNGISTTGKLLEALASANDPIDALQNALGAFLQQFTFETSVPVAYYSNSMEIIGYNPAIENLWTLEKQRKLQETVEQYRASLSMLMQLKALSSGVDPRCRLVAPETFELIRVKISEYESYLQQLARIHEEIKENQPDQAIPETPQPPDLVNVMPPYPPRAIGSNMVKDLNTGIVLSSEESLAELQQNGGVKSYSLTERLSHPGLPTHVQFFLVRGYFLTKIEFYFEKEMLYSIAVSPDKNSFEVGYSEFNVQNAILHYCFYEGRPVDSGMFYGVAYDQLGRRMKMPMAVARWQTVLGPPSPGLPKGTPEYQPFTQIDWSGETVSPQSPRFSTQIPLEQLNLDDVNEQMRLCREERIQYLRMANMIPTL